MSSNSSFMQIENNKSLSKSCLEETKQNPKSFPIGMLQSCNHPKNISNSELSNYSKINQVVN